MRCAGWIAALLLAVGWWASAARLGTAPPQENDWRRTPAGWQLRSQWAELHPVAQPGLHPALVGLFQLLASAGSLLAWSEWGDRRRFSGAGPGPANDAANHRGPGSRRP